VKRLPVLALLAIAIVGLATWRFVAGPGDRGAAREASSVATEEPGPGEAPPPETRAALSADEAAVTSTESPDAPESDGNRHVARPDEPLTDRATGATFAWQAPTDDVVDSQPPGAPPANSEVDPATGVTMLRGSPDDDTTAVSATGPVPAGVEIDPATGAAIAR